MPTRRRARPPSASDEQLDLSQLPRRTLTATVDGHPMSWTVHGHVVTGGPEVLLDGDDDLLAGTEFRDRGFTVVPMLEPAELERLRAGVTRLVADDIAAAGLVVPRSFDLAGYHETVRTDAEHRAVTAVGSSYHPIDELPVDVAMIDRRVSGVVGQRVRSLVPADVPASFGVRVVRPRSGDNNPPHKDAWLPRLRHTITIYLPLAGSTAASSLTLVPGSHLWPESETDRTAGGGIVDGARFSVPAVAGARRRLEMLRPNPGPGEVLLFSPYLVHGGAKNLEHAVTRVSLELRFERDPR